MKTKIFSSFFLTILSSGLLFVFNFYLAKVLGSNIYGEIIYYLSFVNLMALVISLNHPSLYMGNKISKDDDKTFSLFFSIESILFLIALVPGYFIINSFIEEKSVVVIILITSYLMTILGTIGLEFNSNKEIPKSILISMLIPRILLIVFFILFFTYGYKQAIYYLYSYSFSYFLVVVSILIVFKLRFYIKKELFDRAWKFYLLGFIGTSFTYIAQIAQKEYGGYSELASLGIAVLIFTGLSLVGSILIKFALPNLHLAWKEKKMEKIEEMYMMHTFMSSLVNVPIFLILIYNIELISEYLGNGYELLPMFLYIMGVGYIFDLFSGITGTILRVTENEKYEVYNELMRLVVGLLSIYLLRDNPYGIAIAISISMVVYNVAKYIQVFMLYKYKPLEVKTIFILLIYIGLITFLLYGATTVFEGISVLMVSICIVLCAYLLIYKLVKRTINLGVYK
jgi:O-antigen/teichoic acid export membrane protein